MGEEAPGLQTMGGWTSVLEKYHRCLPSTYSFLVTQDCLYQRQDLVFGKHQVCPAMTITMTQDPQPAAFTHCPRDSTSLLQLWGKNMGFQATARRPTKHREGLESNGDGCWQLRGTGEGTVV